MAKVCWGSLSRTRLVCVPENRDSSYHPAQTLSKHGESLSLSYCRFNATYGSITLHTILWLMLQHHSVYYLDHYREWHLPIHSRSYKRYCIANLWRDVIHRNSSPHENKPQMAKQVYMTYSG
jgi:hypothetical protein